MATKRKSHKTINGTKKKSERKSTSKEDTETRPLEVKRNIKLLVACHCEPKEGGYEHNMHNPLHFKVNENISIDTIHYMDTNEKTCPVSEIQFNDWSKIPDNTYDYIWFEHCPFYGVFNKSKEFDRGVNIWNKLLTPALQKLTSTGKIYVPYSSTPNGNKMNKYKYIETANKIFKINKNDATFKIINYKDLDIQLSEDEDADLGFVIENITDHTTTKEIIKEAEEDINTITNHKESKELKEVVKVELKDHQKNIVSFMKTMDPRGLILYHGLGSGKTITAISIAELYPDRLVICIVPASMRIQWSKELEKMHVDHKRYQIMSYEKILKVKLDELDAELENEYMPSIRKTRSYTQTVNNQIGGDNYDNSVQFQDKIVIIDEAHRLRNPGRITGTLTRKLNEAHRVILLTGTPMQNSPIDFSSLANIVYGKHVLPISDKAFNDKFLVLYRDHVPSENRRCKEYSPVLCSEYGYRVNSKTDWCHYHNYLYQKELYLKYPEYKRILFKIVGGKDKVQSFKIDLKYEKEQETRIQEVRNKFKAAGASPNAEEFAKYVKCLVSYYVPNLNNDYATVKKTFMKVKMSPEQNTAYKIAVQDLPEHDMKALMKGDDYIIDYSRFNAFLNKTRQISNTAVPHSLADGLPDSPKFKEILEVCKNGAKPVVIYSNWLESGLYPMKSMLDENKISNEIYTGKLNDVKKNQIVKKYNDGEVDVLLLSSSGSEGLDLKNTRQIHIMEPHWNLAKIEQVIGRGVRYKSHESLPEKDRHVDIYFWMSMPELSTGEMGADEYLYQIGNQKVKMMEEFMKIIVEQSIENQTKNGKNGCVLRSKSKN